MNNRPRLILIIGDIVIFMFFAFTGRETHAPGDANLIVNALPTLLTFLTAWFAIAVLSHVYQSAVIAVPRSAALRTLLAWCIAAPIAIVIRAFLLSRTAIHWQFVAVTMGLVGTLLEEQTATQARHGSYYLTFFGQADGRLRSSTQRQTLVELTAEMNKYRVAWDWAVTHGEFALIEQTMRTFFRLHDTRGWYQEGLDTLDRALAALETSHGNSPPDRTEQVALGHLLATRSWLAYRLANYEQAQRMLERSLEILRPLNEPDVLVESITYLGRVMEMTGDYPRALELYSEGLEIATASGNRWFKAVCLTLHTALVGFTYVMVSPEITHERLQSVVAEWRIIGDPRLIAFGLEFLSRSALRRCSPTSTLGPPRS